MNRSITSRLCLFAPLIVVSLLAGCGDGGSDDNGGSNDNGGSDDNGSPSYSVSLSTTGLTFNHSVGGPPPAPKTVTATFNGDGLVVGYPEVSDEVPWLDIRQDDPDDTTSPVVMEFLVDSTDVPVGTHSTTVRFVTGNANGSDGTYVDLTVTLEVANQLTISETELTFSQVNGAPAPPDTQLVELAGEGLEWTATASEDWISLASNNGTAPSSLEVGIDTASLTTSGAYEGSITVESEGQSHEIDVALNLEPLRLFVEDDGVAFSSFPTSGSALDFSVVVKDSAGAGVTWNASTDQSWLTVTSMGVTGGALELTADPMGLATDAIHYGEVTVASLDSKVESGDTITVGFYVAGSDPSAADSGVVASYITADPVRPYVYVTDESTDVDVYNIYTGEAITSITAGTRLKDMIASSDGSMLYVIDGDDDTIVPIDLETNTVGTKWQADNFSAVYASLEYMRLYDRDVLITSRTEVFDAETGSLITELDRDFSGVEHAIAAARDGESVYALTANVSGILDLQRYTMECSSITGACAVVPRQLLSRLFGNVRDIAVTNDGTKIYTASGGDYYFPTFFLTDDAIVEGAALEGTTYPVAAELGPTGTFYGGTASLGSLTPVDVWSYASDNSPEGTFDLTGELASRQLQVSGDGLRLITLSDSVVFSDVGGG